MIYIYTNRPGKQPHFCFLDCQTNYTQVKNETFVVTTPMGKAKRGGLLPYISLHSTITQLHGVADQ